MRSDKPIELLIFSIGRLLFGVYAGQVAKVVHTAEVSVPSEDGFFPFVFRSGNYQGIYFRNWLDHHTLRKGGGCEQKHTTPSTLLLITSSDCLYRGVLIDRVEEFKTVSLGCLHPLPLFMHKIRHLPALWGIAYHENSMVLLIDLLKLLCK